MKDRDYTLILDKSGSMSTPDQQGGRSRWEIAQESTLALARKCEQFDPDGITVYVFSGRFKRYDDVTSSKPNGETILVITDGEPDDRRAVFEVIITATRQMEQDEELAISMIQVGSDAQATKFLKALDDQLQGVGAKFDICDTITLDDLEDISLADVLMNAISD